MLTKHANGSPLAQGDVGLILSKKLNRWNFSQKGKSEDGSAMLEFTEN